MNSSNCGRVFLYLEERLSWVPRSSNEYLPNLIFADTLIHIVSKFEVSRHDTKYIFYKFKVFKPNNKYPSEILTASYRKKPKVA